MVFATVSPLTTRGLKHSNISGNMKYFLEMNCMNLLNKSVHNKHENKVMKKQGHKLFFNENGLKKKGRQSSNVN